MSELGNLGELGELSEFGKLGELGGMFPFVFCSPALQGGRDDIGSPRSGNVVTLLVKLDWTARCYVTIYI